MMRLVLVAALLGFASGAQWATRGAMRQGAGTRGVHRETLLFNKQTVRHRSSMGHHSSFALSVIHKTAYWGTVHIGKPAQEFKVIFDTGSGNLILPAKGCDMAGCNSHKKYNSNASTTGKAVQNERGEGSTEISFGTGDITGDYFEDKFCIGDSLCTEARFIAASEMSDEPFEETPFDGIMGMGFKDLSMGKSFNIVDDLNDNGQLPQGIFSVFLSDDGASEITFGGYRPESLASDVVWAHVGRESYWQVAVDDITFDNSATGLCDGECQVAVDTGTSMLAGPSDLVDKLRTKLGANDDCSNFDKLPKIGFKIGDRILNLAPDDYMDKQSGDCSFSLMALDVPPPKGPLFIFGDPFLRRFVTIYDRTGPRVGFAVAKHANMDAAEAENIISKVSEDSSETAVVSKASGYDPKQVALNLDSGMMTGDDGQHADHGEESKDADPDGDAAGPLPPKAAGAEAKATSSDATATDAAFAKAMAADDVAAASKDKVLAAADAADDAQPKESAAAKTAEQAMDQLLGSEKQDFKHPDLNLVGRHLSTQRLHSQTHSSVRFPRMVSVKLFKDTPVKKQGK